MCIIPYGTQLGEISFCAYNTGAGWRQIIEEMHQTATLADWYRDKGRHPIYAGGKSVPLPTYRPRPATSPEELPQAAKAKTEAGMALPSFGTVAGK